MLRRLRRVLAAARQRREVAAGEWRAASLLGVTKRKDGKRQVTYAGHPLYTYVGDTKAGMTSGEGRRTSAGRGMPLRRLAAVSSRPLRIPTDPTVVMAATAATAQAAERGSGKGTFSLPGPTVVHSPGTMETYAGGIRQLELAMVTFLTQARLVTSGSSSRSSMRAGLPSDHAPKRS